MVALIDKVEAKAVEHILLQIADTYPQVHISCTYLLYIHLYRHCTTLSISVVVGISLILLMQEEKTRNCLKSELSQHVLLKLLVYLLLVAIGYYWLLSVTSVDSRTNYVIS